MESRMEQQVGYSREQIQFAHREFQAENSRLVDFCRQEYENVKLEALRHQQYWVTEVNNHQRMLTEVQTGMAQ